MRTDARSRVGMSAGIGWPVAMMRKHFAWSPRGMRGLSKGYCESAMASCRRVETIGARAGRHKTTGASSRFAQPANGLWIAYPYYARRVLSDVFDRTSERMALRWRRGKAFVHNPIWQAKRCRGGTSLPAQHRTSGENGNLSKDGATEKRYLCAVFHNNNSST